jgi:hypothetical protein
MKSPIKIIFLVILFSITSWYITQFYYLSIEENRKEDIITREIKLLENVKSIQPPCDELLESAGPVVSQKEGYVFIWKIKSNHQYIEKFVVDSNYMSALDQINNSCSLE